MDSHVYYSTIYNSQAMESIYMSINGWMVEENVAYIYNGALSSHEKKEILSFVTTWMNLEDIILNEISQA